MPGDVFNLMRAAWLPVRRASGVREWVAPWQIVEAEDPIQALDWARPDFNGAGLEFLIGLVATAMAPRDLDAWDDGWRQPPEVAMFRAATDALTFAFDLDGEGPRFMQELGGLEEGTRRDLASLLIDQPGEQSIQRNADHFVKAGSIRRMSRAAAAMALYTVQTYSPAGGAGFMTSLRGGGPLTTVVVPDSDDGQPTLWRQVWANVPLAPRVDWRAQPEKVFPWLAPTRSARTHPATTEATGHPRQCFWGMPRRVRLLLEAEAGPCDLGGPDDRMAVVGWETRQYGVKYVGWRHPLTPYTEGKGTEPANPRKGQPGGVSYRHWLGLVQEDPDHDRTPAQCVTEFRRQRAELVEGLSGIRLRAFGYDMDNMKARCWYESEMPVPLVPAGRRADLERQVAQLVKAADAAAGFTRFAVKKARFSNPSDASGDFSHITDSFWQMTEGDFHAAIDGFAQAGDPHDPALREAWLRVLQRAGLRLFDTLVPSEGVEWGAWKRMVEARRWLAHALDDKNVRGSLDLGQPDRAGKRKERAK